MRIENMDNWPIEAVYSIYKTLQKVDVQGKGATVLFANPATIKALDTQIPTIPATYRQYLLMSGMINEIVEDYDGIVGEDEAYVFRGSASKVK